MADMDLREMLAEAATKAAMEGSPDYTDKDDFQHLADALLARLSRPDVLDEFERRCKEAMTGDPARSHPRNARRVLADMLGGGS